MYMDEYGFIITRYVTQPFHNKLWGECYDCIRQFYPLIPIMIIDDRSPPSMIDYHKQSTLTNCQIINSEYPQRGELLAYYYFYKLHPFKKCVYLQDKMFIKKFINFQIDQEVKFLMYFNRFPQDEQLEKQLIGQLHKSQSLVKHYDSDEWQGCPGICAVVNWSFVDFLENEHKFFSILLNKIDNRLARCCLERIFGCLASYYYPTPLNQRSILGYRYNSYNQPITWNMYQATKHDTLQPAFIQWICMGR